MQHYTRDHAKNRAIEILTVRLLHSRSLTAFKANANTCDTQGELRGQEKPPKLLLISHQSHPLLPKPRLPPVARPPSASTTTTSTHSLPAVDSGADDSLDIVSSPSLSDCEISGKAASRYYFQKQKQSSS